MSTLLLKLTTRPNTATGKLQIRRFQPPHSDLTSNYNELGLTTVSREKPRLVYTNNLYCPAETIVESLTYIFAAGMVYLYSNFCGGSENRIFSAIECVSAVGKNTARFHELAFYIYTIHFCE